MHAIMSPRAHHCSEFRSKIAEAAEAISRDPEVVRAYLGREYA